MTVGTVQMFDDIKGRGRIIPDENKCIVHVKHKDILTTGYKSLHEGQRVRFEMVHTQNGIVAKNVVPEGGEDSHCLFFGN